MQAVMKCLLQNNYEVCFETQFLQFLKMKSAQG